LNRLSSGRRFFPSENKTTPRSRAFSYFKALPVSLSGHGDETGVFSHPERSTRRLLNSLRPFPAALSLIFSVSSNTYLRGTGGRISPFFVLSQRRAFLLFDFHALS